MSAAALVSAIGWALLHFVWQGALVGCVTALALTVLRNSSPERRYAAACAGLLACLAWPLASLLLSLQAGPDATRAGLDLPGGVAGVAQGAAGGLLAWLQNHLAWIVVLWAACACALALRMALGLVWIGRAGGASAADPAWQARLSRMAEHFGLGREVRLRIVDNLASPITAGWWRPVVLVPAALVSGMSPTLLEALLAHELGHIKRHDYLVNLLQNVIETLLYYHPAVWWISHRIRFEREQIADDFAARQLGDARRLALALSELERLQFSGHHLAQAANGGDLMARIRRLLRPDAQALDWKAALPVLGLALACAFSAHALKPASAPASGSIFAPAPVNTHPDMLRGASNGPIADFSTCAKPEYPHADLQAGHQGTVTLAFLVGIDGRVAASKVSRSSGYATMDEASRSAIAQCTFKPGMVQGRAMAQWTSVQYVWTLE